MLDDDAVVLKLFDDFAIYREQTAFTHQLRAKGVKRTMPKSTPEKLAVLKEMLLWCRTQEVEPRQWMFTLFACRGWKYPPKLETGHLCSKNMIEKYRRQKGFGRGLGFFRKRLEASAEDRVEADPNRDLIPMVEVLKRGYADTGQYVRCREETLVTTLGFHPKSLLCQRCPEARSCAIDLQGQMPFSIIALRSGKITAEEAERQAQNRGSP